MVKNSERNERGDKGGEYAKKTDEDGEQGVPSRTLIVSHLADALPGEPVSFLG